MNGLTPRLMTRVVLIVCLGSFWDAIAVAQQAQPHPQSRLETAIAEAIRLLEAKEYKTFLTKFMAPDDYKRITEAVAIDLLAEKFAGDRAEHFLKVLHYAKKQKPTLSEDGKLAVFNLDESLRLPNRDKLVFEQIDGLWYIRN